jgi:hypothetical protein
MRGMSMWAWVAVWGVVGTALGGAIGGMAWRYVHTGAGSTAPVSDPPPPPASPSKAVPPPAPPPPPASVVPPDKQSTPSSTVPSSSPAPANPAPPAPSAKAETKARPPIEPPSLLSLFMNDLKPRGSLTWNFYRDVETSNQRVVRLFFNVYNDFIAHVYFAAFYVPEPLIDGKPASALNAEVINYIAVNHKRLIDDVRSQLLAESKGAGDVNVESTASLTFSGRVYVYHEGSLTVEQTANLDKAFRAQGAQPQFRGMDYVMAVWSSIRAGDVKSPPKYVLRDNAPSLADEGSK